MGERIIRILVIDDDPGLLAVLEAGLTAQPGYVVTAQSRAEDAMELLKQNEYDLVVSDYSLGNPQLNGMDILRCAVSQAYHPLVIMITAFASLEITLESIHLGAYDFLTKPFQLDELQLVVRNAAEHVHLNRENKALHAQVNDLLAALGDIQQRHAELIERMRNLGEDEGPVTQPEPMPSLDPGQFQDLRRRRIRDQLSAYIRQGETLSEELTRERERVEQMVKNGQLAQSVYQRAIKSGRLGEKS